MDEPNFTFRNGPCDFYSGTKALAEEIIQTIGDGYIWRIAEPFDERDDSRNILSKLHSPHKIQDNLYSLSHLNEAVCACLDLWERRSPFGIYNVTNPGAITSREIVKMVQRILKPPITFEFCNDDADLCCGAAKLLRSYSVMDSSKLLSCGIKMRSVHEALEHTLSLWQSVNQIRDLRHELLRAAVCESVSTKIKLIK